MIPGTRVRCIHPDGSGILRRGDEYVIGDVMVLSGITTIALQGHWFDGHSGHMWGAWRFEIVEEKVTS